MDAGLCAAYLRAAAQLLLDPARTGRTQQSQTGTGVAGDFYFLKVTEPRFAGQPQALTSQLAARLADLTASLNPDSRQTSVASAESLSATQRETRPTPPDLEGFSNFYRLDDGEANVYAAFEQQARRDFVNTLADVRAIKSRVFRLRAVIAVSRGALTD